MIIKEVDPSEIIDLNPQEQKVREVQPHEIVDLDSWLKTVGKGVMGGLSRAGGGLLELVSFLGEGVTGKGAVWDYLRQVSKEAKEFWKPSVLPGSAKAYVGDIVATATQNLANLLVARGSQSLTLGLMGAQAGGEKATEAYTEKGASWGKSAAAGTIQAASEMGTELLPLHYLLKPAQNFFSKLLKVSAADLPGELLNTAIEMKAIDEALLGSDYTVDDYKRALVDTAIVSLGTSGMITAASHPVVKRLEKMKHELDKKQAQPVKVKEVSPEDIVSIEEIKKEGQQAKQEYIAKLKEKQAQPEVKEVSPEDIVAEAVQQQPEIKQPETLPQAEILTQEVIDDKKDKTGLSSIIPGGQTIEQAQPVIETGTKEAQTGGILQKEIKIGSPTYAYTPANDKIDMQFAVVDADALKTSHDIEGRINPEYPQELQPRQRERKASILQIHNIAQKIKPELLEDARTVTEGAPIVGEDLVVESGNGRVLGIRKAYEIGTAEAYRNYLIQNAEKFGLKPEDISNIQKPVLVRIRQTPVDRTDFVKVANERTTLAMSPAEAAKADAQRMPQHLLDNLFVTEDGNLFNSQNRDFVRQFLSLLPQTEQAQYFSETGYTKQLHDRIQSAIFAKAYEDSRLIALQAEEADVDIKNIITALTYASSQFAKINAKFGNITRISKYIAEATQIIRELKTRNMSFEMWKAQQGLFGEGYSAEALDIAEFVYRNIKSAKKLSMFFDAIGKNMLKELEFHAQPNLLGVQRKTEKEIIHETRKEFERMVQEPARTGSLLYAQTGYQGSKERSGTTGAAVAEKTKETVEKGEIYEKEKEEREVSTAGGSIGELERGRRSVTVVKAGKTEDIKGVTTKIIRSVEDVAEIAYKAIGDHAQENFITVFADKNKKVIIQPAVKPRRAFSPEELEEILEHIKKIVAPETEIRILERVTLPKERLQRALQRWGLGELDVEIPIAGAHTVVSLDGKGFYGIIALSLDYMNRTTPYHEAFHNVQKFLLTEEEIERLKRRYPDKDGISSTERQAEAFAQYALGRRNQPVWVRRLFEKIKAFLDALANFVRGKGWTYEDVSDIFEKAYQGEYRTRYERGGDLGLDIDWESLDLENSFKNATLKLLKRAGIKVDKNILVQSKKDSIGLFKAFLASPGEIAGKFRYYVVHAKNAMHTQERLRGIVDEKMKDIFKGLNKKDIDEFARVAWMGDLEGKEYTVDELKGMGVSDKVINAYQKFRKFHKQAWRLIAAHRKQFGLETGYITGHVPHFFENWNVYELQYEEDPETGAPRLVPAGILGTFRSLREAQSFANSLNPDTQILIKPKAFRLPDELLSKTVLKDFSYFRLVKELEEALTISKDEAFEIVNEVARRKNRHRFFGNLAKRTGQTGFRKDDIEKILRQYYYMAARYIAMDEFKARVVPKFEKDFKVELGRGKESPVDPAVAQQVERYIYDVNGVPGEFEILMDNLIKKYLNKYIRTDRPTAWTVNKLMHTMAVLKLGMFNLSTFVVNITQMVNTFSKVPVKHFKAGIIQALKPDAKAKHLFKKLGIQYELGLAQTGGYSYTHLGSIARISMLPFATAEKLNRRVTAWAGYSWAKEKGLSEQEAIAFTRQLIDKTQFDYSVADTARIFRNPAGRLLGQFRPFAIKQLEFIFGLKGVQHIKFWIPMLLMAGGAGVPLIEGLSAFLKWLTGDDPYLEAKKELMKWAGSDEDRQRLAKVLLYGVGSLLGVDVSRRVGLGDVMPKRFEDMLGPTITTLLKMKKVAETGESIDWTEFVKSLTPAIGNLVTAIEIIANDMAVYNPYYRQHLKYIATPSDIVIKATGFRPVQESIISDIEQIRQYEQQQYGEKVKKYVDMIVDGVLNNKPDKILNALDGAIQDGVVISKQQIEEQLEGRLIPQEMRMLTKTRKALRPDYMELMEFSGQ